MLSKANGPNWNRPNWNVRTVSVSLPKGLINQLDGIRGDVNRSKYIQRLIEQKISKTSL